MKAAMIAMIVQDQRPTLSESVLDAINDMRHEAGRPILVASWSLSCRARIKAETIIDLGEPYETPEHCVLAVLTNQRGRSHERIKDDVIAYWRSSTECRAKILDWHGGYMGVAHARRQEGNHYVVVARLGTADEIDSNDGYPYSN